MKSGSWPLAVEGTRSILNDPGSEELLSETCKTLVDRLRSDDKPSSRQSVTLVEILEEACAKRSSADCKAWLQLARGDLFLTTLGNFDCALEAYREVTQLGGDSPAAELASVGLRRVRLESLNSPSR